MKATADQIALIRKIAKAVGGSVRSDYSGRGMFGRTCYGIDCTDRDACYLAIGRIGISKIPKPVTDHMGLDWIVYWPDISVR